MRHLLIFLILLVLFFNLKTIVNAGDSVAGLTLCAETQTLDTRFVPYIENGKLKTDPTCGHEELKIYDWTQCVGQNKEIGVEINGEIADKEDADFFFDTVFDHCQKPLLFRHIAPASSDAYFTTLLSMATFFYVKGTRFINIGNIDGNVEFRKKLLLAYLDFLTTSSTVNYPGLHPANGDPWFKFQENRFANPPNVAGIIGDNFAMFANISDENQNFNFSELSSLNNSFLYSNKKSSPIAFTSNSLHLEKEEVVFITKTAIPSPPIISTSTPAFTPIPTPPPTEAPQPTFIPGGPGSIGQRSFGTSQLSNITNLQSSLEYLLKNLPLPGAKKAQEKFGFDLFLYLIFSAVYIMIIHFAIGIKSEFNIFLMIGYFILGGLVGFWFHSYEGALVLSIILSLIFF